MQFDKRFLFAFGIVLLLVVGTAGGYYWYKEVTFEFVPTKTEDELTSVEEYLEYSKNLEKAYKRDKFGGDTPEETLNLFIQALKDKDVDLAAKYFIIEKQHQIKEDLTAGLESGGVDLLLSVFERERHGRFHTGSTDQYSFLITDENDVVEFSINLIKNSFTEKWKIEEL